MDKKSIQKENIDFFYANLETFLKDKNLLHKYLVIHNQEVKKVFKEFSDAIKFASVNLPQNEYAIQQVWDEEEGLFITS